jgi:hypothetical protein
MLVELLYSLKMPFNISLQIHHYKLLSTEFGCTYFSPEDGDSIFLRNVGIYLHVYTASQPRTLSSPP